MSAIAAAALLALSVASTWLGVLGFVRLTAPFDRLHAVAFVNVAGSALLVAAAFCADGASGRAGKVALAAALTAGGGAALSHALGRMLAFRESAGDSGR